MSSRVLAVALSIAAFVHPAARATPAAATTAALTPCPTGAQQPAGAMCGAIPVPEDRALKGGRTIALNVVVLPSRSAAGHADAVFAIAGGPGAASTGLPGNYPRLYDAIREDHDVVLVDQRGTGKSHWLACSTVDLTKEPARVFDPTPDVKTLTACRDRLSRDADLKQYGTGSAVADLDAVRQSLGYAKINLLAVSYGTRVALEYLRRFGPQVRSIALNGVVAPSVAAGLNGARESQNAMQALITLCTADAACHGAFPKLAPDLDAVFAILDKGPVTATAVLDDKTPPIAVTISRAVFVRELFQLQHSRDDLTALPLAIHLAAAKDFTAFATLAVMREVSRPAHSDAMPFSVFCSQDAPSYTPAAIEAATRGTFMRDARVAPIARACAVWPHAARDVAARAPVRSSVPVLLVSGALDPVTPPASAAEVAATLPNSLQVVVANAAHVPANPCVNGLIVGLLKTGSTKGLDPSCGAALPPIKFLTSLPGTPLAQR